jgi:hypothetical protein
MISTVSSPLRRGWRGSIIEALVHDVKATFMNMAQAILAAQDRSIAEARALRARLDEIVAADAGRRQRDQRFADSTAAIDHEERKRKLRQWRADDAAAEDEERARLRRDGELCLKHQSTYDASAFAPFGRKADQPRSGESGYDYRRRLFTQAQSQLPTGHPLTAFKADALDGHTMPPMQEALFKALAQEAKSPSGDNLPLDANDPKARRDVVDDSTGLRHTEYRAKRSFIWNLSRPGHRVVRLTDGKGLVLWGAPYPQRTP